jgi:hypothetical protein
MVARSFLRLLAGAVAWASTGCAASVPEPAAPLTPPTRLCTEAQPSSACRTASAIDAALRAPELVVLGAAETPQGRQGARILTLALPAQAGRLVFRAKWRAHATLSSLNDPRRELGAHAVQRLFLEPHEYVVPPSAGHCFDLAEYRRSVDPAGRATFAGIDCVFGVLSYWLEDGRGLDDAEDAGWLSSDQRAFDAAWFRRSASYRDSASDLNVLTFLIEHGDSHPDQFIIGGSAQLPRLYSVDNSLSFGSFRNPTVDEDWSRLLVPSIRLSTVQRLRQLTPEQLSSLTVIEQYRIRDGSLVHGAAGAAVNAFRPLRWAGRELQIGLTRAEIARVASRLRALTSSVASGRLATH